MLAKTSGASPLVSSFVNRHEEGDYPVVNGQFH